MSSPNSAEVVTMLDMLEVAKEHTLLQLEGKLIAINDDKFLHNDIHEKWEKAASNENYDKGMVTKIKDLIKKIVV